jgi:hypothetical protein
LHEGPIGLVCLVPEQWRVHAALPTIVNNLAVGIDDERASGIDTDRDVVLEPNAVGGVVRLDGRQERLDILAASSGGSAIANARGVA